MARPGLFPPRPRPHLFGLAGPEGNHGKDVKEVYFYLYSSPTHSYAKMLYKYPQAAFPYSELVAENGRRARPEPEYDFRFICQVVGFVRELGTE